MMITAPEIPGEDYPGGGADARKRTRLPPWRRVTLFGILLISAFLNFYQLGQNGYANLYYAAAIRSMLDSWHNFFFVSFDPGGFVTIDKPPLGFWLQAASAKFFGFSAFSMFLPQALAGVATVLVLYILVRRHFGVVAGLIAAFALAISPISVVTNRNNTIDSTLVLVLLLGAWAVMRAAETGKVRWLLLSAVAVGLGFNIKMLEADLVVPAYGLLYLLASPRKIWVRIVHLALALFVMVVLSFSWIVAVDLTAASQRPYVGSSQDNSELSLAMGYNGIERLLAGIGIFGGNSGNPAGQKTNPGTATDPGQPNGDFSNVGGNGSIPVPEGFEVTGGTQVSPGSGGGMFDTGNPGAFRLFNEPLGGQIVWLLPMALLGLLALAWQRRPRFRENREQQSMILWGTWLLTVAVFFSVASFFHQYYLSTLAPAICALFGIGVVIMWRDYRNAGWRGWLLPLALLLTAAEQIHIITSNPSWGMRLIPLVAVPCIIGAVVLFLARLLPRLRLRLDRRVLLPALGLALTGLLIVSAVWSAYPGVDNIAADLPTAGPSGIVQGGGSGSSGFQGDPIGELPEGVNIGSQPGGGPSDAGGPQGGLTPGGNGTNMADNALIHYLEANRDGAKYLLAVTSSTDAAPIILATNQPVMAMGGFSGTDPILTTSDLAKLVAAGTVRYFMLGNMGGGDDQVSLSSWVEQNCTAVPSSAWESSATHIVNSNASGLYVCGVTK